MNVAPTPTSKPPNNQAQNVLTATSEVEVEYERVVADSDELEEELEEHEWGTAEDIEIEQAMKKIDEWKKKYREIEERKFNIQKKTKSFKLDTTKLEKATSYVNKLGSRLENAIAVIKFEDGERGLFSDNRSKTASVKLPCFAGLDEEDYSQFEKDIKKAFVAYRVRKDDQIKKLREVVKGNARKVIPSTMKNIDEAFKILKNIFEDPSRLMNAKRNIIFNLGNYP